MPNARHVKREKYELAWSVDKNSIYLTNTISDQPVLSISFTDELTGLSQEQKVNLLQELVNGIRQFVTIERTAGGM